MNAMTTFTIKSLRANKVRTLVTIAGVVLAAALLTAVLTSYTSLQAMLYEAETRMAGTWMAEVQGDDFDGLAAQAQEAQAAGQVNDVAYLRDAGFGELTEQQQNSFGRYLRLADFSGDIETLCSLRPSEGRLPEKAGEIMLFDTWRTAGDGVEVGDTITVPVGERVAVLAPGRTGSMTHGEVPASGGFVGGMEAAEDEIAEGTVLDSSIGYLDAALDGGIFNEELRVTGERTYTVVGFYDNIPYVASHGSGMTAFTCGSPDDELTGLNRAYVTMAGVDSTAAVEQRIEEAFPDRYAELHMGLLRYMGVRTDGAIWDTFFNIAAVLAVVIIVACVSLIYNAFAISVAERTGQFGLLASVGASRRQLRRAVALEALIVAAIGVPLGLVVGIGGCAVTFAALGPSLATIFGAAEVGFNLSVAPWALAVAAGLTVATVLFSVFVPAWRASRVNVIDALRGNQSARASKRGAARAARAANPAKLWRGRGIAGRVFGMGGLLARINEKRGASKGMAASVSLALAIVLLMTAGSLSTFLGTLTKVAGGPVDAGDVGVVAMFSDDTAPGGDGTEGADAAGNAPGAEGADAGAADANPAALADDGSLTLEAVVEARNARFAEEAAVYGKAWEVLKTTPDAEPVGWRLDGGVSLIVPEAMVGDAFKADGALHGGQMAAGSFAVMGSVVYLEDAAFDRCVADAGLNPADFRDPTEPRALGVGKAYGNNGAVYELLDVLTATGTVQALTAGLYEGEVVSGFAVAYEADGANGAGFDFVPYVFEPNGADGGMTRNLDPADVETATTPVEVVAVLDEAPELVGMYGESVQLIVPMSLAATHSLGIIDPTFRASFDAPEGRSGEVGDDLVNAAGTFFHDEAPFEVAFLAMNDYAGDVASNQTLAMVVNVFCLLFTVILALIAMANVFNTVTNGLILRRREFAVMRSVGLSNRQFRAMIVDECVAWCARGLVPGVLLSLLVSWLLWVAVSGSLSGLSFMVPWAYVALAFAMTAAAVGISVAYGMHRCKADNVVEALRMDSV